MTLNFTVNKPINEVFEYLSDMQKLVSVHPIIFRIDNIEKNNYLVFEKLRILFIPVTFKYTVEVESKAEEKEVLIKAVVMKMININMMYTLANGAGKTQVKEIITFKTLLPVKFILSRIFKTQHQQLFLNINKA